MQMNMTDKLYTREGDYIYLGEYPQSAAPEGVEINGEADSRGYCPGSDGRYYARVTATPKGEGYRLSTGAELHRGESYFFRVEPLKWRILAEGEGKALVLCDRIIANMAYQPECFEQDGDLYTAANGAPDGTFANNYKYSAVRAWLGNGFLSTAFSEGERETIVTAAVDNGINSTAAYLKNPYICEDTEDKIFLLSYREAEREEYGFASGKDRIISTTDYARATGAFISTSADGYGNGFWWLRSPAEKGGNYAMSITNSKSYNKLTALVNSENLGVIPAMYIKL